MGRRGNESLTPEAEESRGSSPGLPNFRGHLPALDGLRGVAILLVLVHHFNLLHPAGPLELGIIRLFDLGKHGVDLFFVLSGFLITGILLDSRGRPGWLKSFFARRVLRIFPLYYLLLVVLLVIRPRMLAGDIETMPAGMHWFREAEQWAWYFGYASNFLFARQEGFGPQGLNVTWSLAIEEQFYLLWAPLVALVGGRRLIVTCVGIIVLSPLVRAAIGLGPNSWLDAYLVTPGRLDGLALGALLAAWLRAPGARSDRLAVTASWTAALAGSALLFIQVGGQLNGFTPIGVVLGLSSVALLSAAGLAGLLLAPAGHWARRLFEGRFLRFLGKYSYGIYLVHMLFRDELQRRFFPKAVTEATHGLPLLAWEAAFLVTGIVLSCAAAWLVWHLWEKPFLGLKRFFPRPGVAATADR